jgi:diamine N-acetyltransferase
MQPNKVNLRALEPSDLDILYRWENDDRIWFSSINTRPLSRQTLQLYIDSVNDIYTDKQVRLIIELEGKPVGCVDLFDFDPMHQRAGVGIMVDQNFERRGLASLALLELKKYAFSQLGLHQLYCSIAQNNNRSTSLFTKANFIHTGTKKSWLRIDKSWEDELFFQCFND